MHFVLMFIIGASEHENNSCKEVAESLGVGVDAEIEEGEESDEFWDHLGGQDTYRSSPELIAVSTVLINAVMYLEAVMDLGVPPPNHGLICTLHFFDYSYLS